MNLSLSIDFEGVYRFDVDGCDIVNDYDVVNNFGVVYKLNVIDDFDGVNDLCTGQGTLSQAEWPPLTVKSTSLCKLLTICNVVNYNL